jgi:hypothetical protein
LIFIIQGFNSSPTIPDAKVRESHSPLMPLDNTDSVLQTDNDGELLVQTSDDSEEFVVIPAPRRRAVTVSVTSMPWLTSSLSPF